MTSPNNIYPNSGSILRQIFPKQLKTQTSIMVWTFILILNIVLVVLVQNFGIYNITDFSKEGLQQCSYFGDCKILSVTKTAYPTTTHGCYAVRYENSSGETHIVCMDPFPVEIFKGARIDKSTDMVIQEDGTVLYDNGNSTISTTIESYLKDVNSENFITLFWERNQTQKLACVYLSLGLIMLFIEFSLYSVFKKTIS